VSAPKLRPDLVFVEQTYRGEQSFIVKDPTTHKYFRFRPVETTVMRSLDGRPVEEAAAGLVEQGTKVTAAALEKFAAKLKLMGLCERTLEERSLMLMERLRADRRQRLKPPLFQGDLLRLRWSVGNPDALFNRWMPRFNFFFTRPGVALALAMFAIYFVVLALKWTDFTETLQRIFSFDFRTIVLMYVSFIFVAAIHELGHGFACKHFGGQVHEIGAMLLYFDLAFFCNVNDAWSFPERRARLWVSAAGSWIQLILAGAVGILCWVMPAGTLLSDLAMTTFAISGILTVILNLNPLIPLDGYYALMDYLEIANLRPRAFGYLGWFVKHHILGIEAPQPPADEREQRIFLCYGALAAVYSGLVLYAFAGIIYGWLDRALGALGVVLFIGGAWLMLRQPIREFGTAALLAARERMATLGSRRRFRLIWSAAAVLVIGALIPRPITVTGGFTAAPALSIPLTAPEDGMVDRVLVREGSRVTAGMPVIEIRNLPLERRAAASARLVDSLTALETRARALGRQDELGRLEAERAEEEARSSGMRAELATLRVRGAGSGIVMTQRPEELPGRWVKQGELMLTLGQPDSVELRIGLSGAGASQVRPGQPVRLIAHADPGVRVTARIASVSAAAGNPAAGSSAGSLEARVRAPAGAAWRPGMTGEASVTLRQSNLWGSLWWALRRRIRSDILL
jgi:putative peptide zinc metalloprotease protein